MNRTASCRRMPLAIELPMNPLDHSERITISVEVEIDTDREVPDHVQRCVAAIHKELRALVFDWGIRSSDR